MLSISAAVLCLWVGTARAGWPGNPTVNVPIALGPLEQSHPQLTTDGGGGAIIVWQDQRTTGSFDIYAQRVDANGQVRWAVNGAPICVAISDQVSPQIVSDGAGGAYIAWLDTRNISTSDTDIYAIRIDSMARPMPGWATDGNAVCTALTPQRNFTLVADGAGGAFIVWEDMRTCYRQDTVLHRRPGPGPPRYDTTYTCRIVPSANSLPRLFAQHLDSTGVSWKTNGLLVTDSLQHVYSENLPQIVLDTTGGMFIVWQENHLGSVYYYAEHMNAMGQRLLDTLGVPIANFPSPKSGFATCADGSNGFYLAWSDGRNSTSDGMDIFAQHASPTATRMWTYDGLTVCTQPQDQIAPVLTTDAQGNLFVVWQDARNLNIAPNYYATDLYGQRLTFASGQAMWISGGKSLVSIKNNQVNQQVLRDANGGFFLSWLDYRYSAGNPDIFVKDVSANGADVWSDSSTGIAVCANTATQDQMQMGAAQGDLIFTWRDRRNPTDNAGDIYAQKVFATGILPVEISSLRAALDPASGRAVIAWTAVDEHDVAGYEILHQSGTAPFSTAASFATSPQLAAHNAATPTNYRFVDAEAGDAERYLLAAVNRDGSRAEFGPVALNRTVPATLSLTEAYPNPAATALHVRLQVPITGATWEVRDLLGRTMMRSAGATLQGGDQRLDVDASSLAPGSYVFSVRGTGGTANRLFQIAR